jgi:hypothetical protein
MATWFLVTVAFWIGVGTCFLCSQWGGHLTATEPAGSSWLRWYGVGWGLIGAGQILTWVLTGLIT